MRKLLVGILLLSALGTAGAAEGSGWKDYYDNLLKGLKSKVQKKFESKTRVSAVAAVRGAKQGSDAEALYWKGGVSEEARKKLAEEKEALTAAVQLVVDGRTAEGRAAIEKFLKDYPESFYASDAREALGKLPAEASAPAAEKNSGAEKETPEDRQPAADTGGKKSE